MSVTAECSACHKKYLVDDRAFGRKLRCKGCGHVFVVEAPRPAASSPAEPEDPFAALVANQLDDMPDPPAVEPIRSQPIRTPAPSKRTRSEPAPLKTFRLGSFGRVENPTAGSGLDTLTPWLIIGFFVTQIVGAIVLTMKSADAASPLHGTPASAFWLLVLLDVAMLFLLAGPTVLLAMYLNSLSIRVKLVDLAYLRACGIAALPGIVLMLLTISPVPLSREYVLSVCGAIWIVTFIAVKLVFELRWRSSVVGVFLCMVMLAVVGYYANIHIVQPTVRQLVLERTSTHVVARAPADDAGNTAVGAPSPGNNSIPQPDANQMALEANRTKTEENLRQIGQAAVQFSSSVATGAFPGDLTLLVNLGSLPAHCLNSPFQSPQKGGYVYWPGRFSGMPNNVVLAYDKAEYVRFKTTHVLFVNGDVQAMAAEALSPAISQSDQSVADWQEDQAAKKRLAMATPTPAPVPNVTTPEPVPQTPKPKTDDFVSQFTAQKSDLVASVTPLPLEGEIQEIVRPLSPSPWIGVVKSNGPAEDTVELWDVNSAQKKGQVSFVHEIGSVSGYAIATNGATIARIVHFPKLAVKTWSVKDNKDARTIILNDKFGEPALAGFLNSDKLAVRWTLGGQEGLEIWDATTGQRGKQVPVEHFQRTVNNGVTSPDGRTLALTTGTGMNGKPQIQFYDMLSSAGKYRWQTIADFDNATADSTAGMAFSPDSKKVAAFFTRNGISVILCWRFSDGKLLTEYEIPLPPAPGAPATGRGLDWVHDGSAWLVMGNLLVDSATGQTIGNLGAPPVTGQWKTGNDAVALTYEAEGQTRVAVVKLNGAKFAATTKPSH